MAVSLVHKRRLFWSFLIITTTSYAWILQFLISHSIINQGPIISDEDYNFLSTPICDDSIKEALFHIEDDNARGPYGYTAAFFKTNWDLIKVDFLQSIHEFFRNGRILKQFNHVAIALIPKAKHVPQAKDFRPISCCNVFYKTITKVIANKLAAAIPNLVDSAQSAFLEERLMSDNILLAQQLVKKYGRKSCTLICMMMVDIRKAFDTVSWAFILNLLHHLGFPAVMINWIRECITIASFSISLNGKIHGFFKSKRYLRQGDPISPCLFVLAMEYLSRSIKAATSNPNINFHPKCEKIGLTHLSFADDIIIFSTGDVQSVSLMFDTLHPFGHSSGLELNLSKSQLFAAGVLDFEFQEMLHLTGFTIGTFPVTYMGSSLGHGKLKTCHFNP